MEQLANISQFEALCNQAFVRPVANAIGLTKRPLIDLTKPQTPGMYQNRNRTFKVAIRLFYQAYRFVLCVECETLTKQKLRENSSIGLSCYAGALCVAI